MNLFTALTSAGLLRAVLRPGQGSQPQPDRALISHSALLKVSFQAMMFEGVSIISYPGH